MRVAASSKSLVFAVCLVAGGLAPAAAAPLVLVTNGRSAAAVVLAETPSSTARYAADELTNHVAQATGVRLPVLDEASAAAHAGPRIFVGDTQAARAQGIDPDRLGPDVYVMRTAGRDLFILGREEREMPPLQGVRYNHARLPSAYVNPYGGTLFGVYEFLSRFAGVRWLWPGHLGTDVPPSDRLIVPDALNETQGPRLKFRMWGWSHIAGAEAYESRVDEIVRKLAFTPEGIRRYRDDLEIYLRRHRLGISEVCPHGVHTFHWWWSRYGKKHPEWFMLNSKGERGPEPGKETAMMCLSNPDIHRYIVERYRAGDLYVTGWAPPDRAAHAGFIPLAESDTQGGCRCERCQAWDAPQPETVHPHVASNTYHFRNIFNPLKSNRYARFWKTIYDLAAQEDPGVKVGVYLYWNTFPAPTADIQLNPNIWGEFAPWSSRESYFPMPDVAEQWMKEQWLGWRRSGLSLVYRPNYFHCGYVMPQVSTRQAGEFFRWAYQNGMVATSFDSLYGHWSVRGPMLYMLMRLFWDPELEIDAIRREYFSAFGLAAAIVERYFDYWEAFSETRRGGWLHGDVARVNDAFPPDSFPPAEQMLAEALQAVQGEPRPEFGERVRFLQAGLEHARLAARFMDLLDAEPKGSRKRVPAVDSENRERARLALAELIAFRRARETDYLADFLDAANREKRAVIGIEELLP